MTNSAAPLPPAWSAPVQYLLSPEAVRERCQQLFAHGQQDRLLHLRLDLTRWDHCVDYVAAEIKNNYPKLDIPYHSRFRHFTVAGHDRWAPLRQSWSKLTPLEQGRRAFELVMVSVLLDAGAGPHWRFRDAASGNLIGRSEGLALASLEFFTSGICASDSRDPTALSVAKLQQLKEEELAGIMQVSPSNPLVGLTGRTRLLNQLGETADCHPGIFTRAGNPRLGHLFDYLVDQAQNRQLPARTVLIAVLQALGNIWPGRIVMDGVNLGDCWRHPLIEADDESKGLIPFHKLSQWLAYSLMEPLESHGISITGMDQLTGLAEYRNGGLFVDLGVITLKRPEDWGQAHESSSPLVVEWRALTVALLDELAGHIRKRLNLSSAAFPLVKLLQGGTWTAGRRIAMQKRPDASPPLSIISDGTLF